MLNVIFLMPFKHTDINCFLASNSIKMTKEMGSKSVHFEWNFKLEKYKADNCLFYYYFVKNNLSL